MALRTSVGTGNWATAGTWDTGVPVNGDTFAIAAGHTVTLDKDNIGDGVTLGASTIAATGTLICSTTTGTYSLSLSGDLTVSGTLQAGTSVAVPLPSDVTFTIDFTSGNRHIVRSDTGHIYLYCFQPTNPYITITEALDTVEVDFDVDTDVTSDTAWADGAEIRIINSTPKDTEIRTIAGGGIAAGAITVTAALTNTKTTGSLMVLITRNIRIINVASSGYAITYASQAVGTGDHIAVEIRDCWRGISQGTGYEFAGTMELLTTAPIGMLQSLSATMSGSLTGTTTGTSSGVSVCKDMVVSGLIAGMTNGLGSGFANTLSGRVFGCTYGNNLESSLQLISSGVMDYCTTANRNSSGLIIYGTIENCTTYAIENGTDQIMANATFTNNSKDMESVGNGRAYNTSFGSGTEFNNYNANRLASAYFESFDHDQVTNAYKAWTRGGIITSDETTPPTGYDRWYEHACEYVSTGSYACFRQFETVVLSGEAIEVIGKIRIADGEDLSTDPPALQIIDKFSDPLVDNTQSPLAEDEIPEPDGGVEAGWQDVSVIWANQGDAPRTVIVRMYASVAGVTADVDVDEVWAIATYKDQIAKIYQKVKRLSPTSNG
jgi:hypothetical protein